MNCRKLFFLAVLITAFTSVIAFAGEDPLSCGREFPKKITFYAGYPGRSGQFNYKLWLSFAQDRPAVKFFTYENYVNTDDAQALSSFWYNAAWGKHGDQGWENCAASAQDCVDTFLYHMNMMSIAEGNLIQSRNANSSQTLRSALECAIAIEQLAIERARTKYLQTQSVQVQTQ